MEVSRGVNAFLRFYARLTAAHLFSYVLVGGISYMLIMRHSWDGIPADTGVRAITSSHVQFWIWPMQFFRGLILAAVFFPLRQTLLKMGRGGGLLVAGMMVGLGCLAGFNGLLENLIFYRNVSLYLYYIHIPEILGQTLLFGYALMWVERNLADDGLQTMGTGRTRMGVEAHHDT
jgi:hypothetical protein